MYVGFGSLVVDDPKGLTRMILSAAKRTHQRVLLSRCHVTLARLPYGVHDARDRAGRMVASAPGCASATFPRASRSVALLNDVNACWSRGWGNLGEGFNIPPEVMLLDAVRPTSLAMLHSDDQHLLGSPQVLRAVWVTSWVRV